jgi:hypothetical protein
MKKTTALTSCLVLALTSFSCGPKAGETTGQAAGRGAAYGAAGGALLGLGLGAMAGQAGRGAAAGAMVGAAGGAMYEYGEHREDNRTAVLANSIGGAKQGETVDDAGKRHFEDFMGTWNLDIWALLPDGNRVTATGRAKGVLEGPNRARVEYSDIRADGYDQVVAGNTLFAYAPDEGFVLENTFSTTNETHAAVGEYVPDGNKYNFYLTTGEGGESITGVIRSNVRIEVRIAGPNLWIAETYTLIDGKEKQMQSYRFTRSG